MRMRASSGRVRGGLIPVLLGVSAAVACSDFDATRTPPPRGDVGTEMFGVICDRVGAQGLHEDLSGASYHDVCHPAADGTFSDTVDTDLLPQRADNRPAIQGNPVPLAQQQQDRAYGVARVETLARHRSDLIAAFDAMFPDDSIALVDPSCNASGQGSL